MWNVISSFFILTLCVFIMKQFPHFVMPSKGNELKAFTKA